MSDLPARLRDALSAADFTYDAVADLLGPRASAALERNETTPGLRRTADGSALATLVRLFLLQVRVSEPAAAAGAAGPGRGPGRGGSAGPQRRRGGRAPRLPPLLRRRCSTCGWSATSRPAWTAPSNRVAADHVLGISSASTSLAQLTLRHPVGSALDLGTGCGVQALHLSTHSARVVATDVNQRAL